jgi:hypothetical protein
MADISSYERSQNRAAAKKAKDAGDITDRAEHKGKKNFRGPSSSKSGIGVSPKASGSPWDYGRSSQSEGHDYSADYTRKGSSDKSSGPYKPSDKIPDSIYGGKNDLERGQQTSDHK